MNSSFGLILLTYKGKVLLMHKQNSELDPVKHPWSFISAKQKKNESFEDNLKKRIQEEMGIKIENIKSISKYYYFARLTDANVNNIKRKEHQLLDFFTPEEVKKLFLSLPTQDFILKHGLNDIV